MRAARHRDAVGRAPHDALGKRERPPDFHDARLRDNLGARRAAREVPEARNIHVEGIAATRYRGISTSQPRRLAATRYRGISTSQASPRLVTAESPRRSRGVAATCYHGISTSQPRRRDPSPRNIHAENERDGHRNRRAGERALLKDGLRGHGARRGVRTIPTLRPEARRSLGSTQGDRERRRDVDGRRDGAAVHRGQEVLTRRIRDDLEVEAAFSHGLDARALADIVHAAAPPDEVDRRARPFAPRRRVELAAPRVDDAS